MLYLLTKTKFKFLCDCFVGRDGIVIVDTTESEKCASEILQDFRKITQKPIKGIVLTHFHAGDFAIVLRNQYYPCINVSVFPNIA